MFGLSELGSLIISAFIILPLVIFLRETGYLITSWIFGVQNPRFTIGAGQRIFKLGMFDVRRHYHLYSWFSYDSIKRNSKFAYILIYSGPILINVIFGLTINTLVANGILVDYKTFWDRLIFYSFYYVLFDAIPMITVYGKPNNGRIIYDMLRHGKRTDYNHESLIPSTRDLDEEYEEELKVVEKEELKKEGK